MTRLPSARRDAGSVSLELVVLSPVVLAVLCLVVGLARIADAGGEVTGAARDAARAASLVRTPEAARYAARDAVIGDLAAGSVACHDLQTVVDTSEFTAGGVVRVTVHCTVSLADVAIAGLPGSKMLTGTSTAPLELFRSVG